MTPISTSLTPDHLRRVIIENVRPQIDAGRFPVKRCVGESVSVKATIHTDGSDVISALLRFRMEKDKEWQETPLIQTNVGKDLWEAQFPVTSVGDGTYSLHAWINTFVTWRGKLSKKHAAGQNIEQDLQEGALLVREAEGASSPADRGKLKRVADLLGSTAPITDRVKVALDEQLPPLMWRWAPRPAQTDHPALPIRVDRERARTGAWYELFPRSTSPTAERSGTLLDAESVLGDIAAMGFDVVYLPPVHPIGKSFRKGPNNSTTAGPNDPGSPWAIGSSEGGHKDVDPALGTLGDFDHFVNVASLAGLETALDIAFQCSPNHPYVKEHPDWFRRRPDGSIQYAENPPKKYEDIYPFDFECKDWKALWTELKSIVLFWAGHGVRIFRIDNPHTKPFHFWEWLIKNVQDEYPDAIFLAEAFTRPAVMQYLAKSGFTQSYSYFTWRTKADELTEYLTELTQTDVSQYMRPNFFVNTPDILHEYLQTGGRAAHQIRFILAATLAASYGIYGPPFELCESKAFPGTEDYVDSEKYQVRVWNRNQEGNIKGLITQVNRFRREYPALQTNEFLTFIPVDNPMILAYSKTSPLSSDGILVIINLDPKNTQAGWVSVPRALLKLSDPYNVEDLLSHDTYAWHGEANFVQLDPISRPAHIFRFTHGEI